MRNAVLLALALLILPAAGWAAEKTPPPAPSPDTLVFYHADW